MTLRGKSISQQAEGARKRDEGGESELAGAVRESVAEVYVGEEAAAWAGHLQIAWKSLCRGEGMDCD